MHVHQVAAELDGDADMALLLTGFRELCSNMHPQCRVACAQAFSSVMRHATSRRCSLPLPAASLSLFHV